MRAVSTANHAKVLVIGLAIGLTSCSEMATIQCIEGREITDRALLDLAVGKIVRQSLASTHPAEIRYASPAVFHEQNPDCCFVSRPERLQGGVVSLPVEEEVELTIRYRRSNGGAMPYRLRHVAIGPCPSDMEESEQRLSAQQLEASKHQLLGRKIN